MFIIHVGNTQNIADCPCINRCVNDDHFDISVLKYRNRFCNGLCTVDRVTVSLEKMNNTIPYSMLVIHNQNI